MTQGCFEVKLVMAVIKTVTIPTLSFEFATYTAPLAG
jgi:hypothetical protein